MVAGLAKAAGLSASTTSSTYGGMTLMGHAQHRLNAIEDREWVVVVIQKQSQNSAFSSSDVSILPIDENLTFIIFRSLIISCLQ